ncbi:MAG: ribosome-associated translation inhibitor RaiA [SAR202 cluster bacterium]|nr:ribosome-associated translation inhibitor RaiA [SAR202 cluster bacterium]
MDLHVHGRNLEISDKTQEHIESKLEPINRRLPGISDANVELAYEPTRSSNDRIMAQVTLHVGGTLLRAQQRAANTKSAINSVAKALDQQIKRYKSHTYRSERKRQTVRGANEESAAWYTNGTGPAKNSGANIEEADDDYVDGQVVRVKEFDMEPMSMEEAAARMQFLGHSFYMFLDSESDKLGVLYVRGDGNYGLIQPKDV